MDEIDYFPKRDKFRTHKDMGASWNKLKKQKASQPSKVKSPKTPAKKVERKKLDNLG